MAAVGNPPECTDSVAIAQRASSAERGVVIPGNCRIYRLIVVHGPNPAPGMLRLEVYADDGATPARKVIDVVPDTEAKDGGPRGVHGPSSTLSLPTWRLAQPGRYRYTLAGAGTRPILTGSLRLTD
ncbi:hypothetical protein DES41_107170 [Pseudorhodoferax soli]|uniref:Uncharacterized protein n=2 Tax=Pseudorhodoferax soli TaxID=545864 RepID=A0A368XM75_9BURK|nr:hypothetical protein DES41_107170 [Pseudorhodoferax soli]